MQAGAGGPVLARRGFTLIELLVVIAIVAILAAILFPVLTSTREHARQSKCLANLKQLNTALRQYTDDNESYVPPMSQYHFPGKVNWCGTLQTFGVTRVEQGSLWPYTRSRDIYICPSDVSREARGLDKGLVPDRKARQDYPLSYSMNGELHKYNKQLGRWEILKIDSLPRGKVTRVMFLIHESRDTINDGLYLWRNNDCDKPDKIHYDGTTALYCDGHARWLPNSELLRMHRLPSDWDPDPTR